MQFVINIFAKDAKIKKLEVAKCNIIKKGMMQGSVAWKNSGTECLFYGLVIISSHFCLKSTNLKM
jgi:hypothetical protein